MPLKKFIALILIVFPLLIQATDKHKWELISNDDGIIVHRDNAFSKGVIPVKASMLVDQTLEEIVAVILDTKRKAEWAPRVPAVTILKKESLFDIIEYAQLAFPWPFSDRFFIVRSTMSVTPKKDKIVINLHSVDDPYKPKSEDYVRGHVYNGGMEIEKVGNKVKVTAHLFTDPRGSIPVWVVNMFSEKTSVAFMKSLRKQINKGLYGPKRLVEVTQHIHNAAEDTKNRLPATKIGTNP